MRALRSLISAAAVVILLAGCNASVSKTGGELTSPKAEVEEQVATQLAASVQQPKPKVVCPTGLPGQVGASITCVLTPQNSTVSYDVVVTATGVNPDTKRIEMDAQVANTPRAN